MIKKWFPLLLSLLSIFFSIHAVSQTTSSPPFDSLTLIQYYEEEFVDLRVVNSTAVAPEMKRQAEYAKVGGSEWLAYALTRNAHMHLRFFNLNKDSVDYERCFHYYAALDSIAEGYPESFVPSTLRAYNALKQTFTYLRMLDRAMDMANRVEGILHAQGRGQGAEMVELLSDKGNIFGLQGNHSDNLRFSKKAYQVFLGLEEQDALTRVSLLNGLASGYNRVSEPERALVYNQMAVAALKSDSSAPVQRQWGALYLNQAVTLSNLDRYEEAQEVLLKVVDRYHQEGVKPVGWATVYGMLGAINFYLKDPSSITYLQLALDANREIGNVIRINNARGNLVKVRYHLEGLSPTLVGDIRSLIRDIKEKSNARSFELKGELLMMLGRHFRESGMLDSALYCFHRSVELFQPDPERIDVVSHPFYAQSFRREVAHTYFEEWKASGNPDYRSRAIAEWEVTWNHMNYFRALHSYKEARNREFKEAIKVHEIGLEMAMNQEFARDSAFPIDRAFEVFESGKSFVLSQSLHDQRVRFKASIPDSLLEQDRALHQDINRLAQQVFRAQVKGEKENAKTSDLRLIKAKFERDSLNEVIDQQFPSYHQLRKKFKTTGLQAVQRDLLDSRSALLGYFLGEKHIFLFTITDEAVFLDSLPHSRALIEEITAFREAISDYDQIVRDPQGSFRTYVAMASGLYQKLIPESSLKLIADRPQWIILPDGALNYVPFEALLTATVNGSETVDYRSLPYLIHDREIRYGYSGTWLHQHRGSTTRELSYLGMAPAYDTTQMKQSEELLAFRAFRDHPVPLTGNVREVEKTHAMMGGKVLLNQAASEASFKREAGNHNVLHFAMHSLMDDHRPMNSQLLFSSNADSVDDGSLFAYELYNLQLAADLVVMSACNSGNGRLEEGEGIMSLARSFSDAGCPSLVMSLWQADDLSASDLVVDFFAGIQESKTKGAALRQAKLNYLASAQPERAHPFFWTNLVVLGNNEPLVAPGVPWVWWLVAGLVLLPVGWWLLRKRA